jgi:hypothetical protein
MSENRSYIWPNLAGGPVLTDKQGIDYLIIADDQTRIEAHFLKPVVAALVSPALYRIEGGDRVKTVTILQAIKKSDRVIELVLDRFGDWAPYRLVISDDVWNALDIDPVFSWVSFSFKVNCPNDLDCKAHLPGFEKFPALGDFDYQAKDYESFKQAMLDRLSLTIPDWWDRAEADFGIALVDLLAYVGDRLSYYQDRVAAESLLTTARARQSVSGHLKLIDYALDPGETATAVVYFEVGYDVTIPEGTEVETPAPDIPSAKPVPFTLRMPFPAYRDLNRLQLYDFSHPSLAIPKGALQTAIVGHPEGIEQGSTIVVVKDFNDTTASGRRKITGEFHLITLSSQPAYKKSFDGTDITVLTWDESCALPWDLPLSGGVVLGNIARLCHGKTHQQSFYVDGTLESYDLPEGPLGYQNGEPMIRLTIDGEVWNRVTSLKESRPYDMHYQVVDLDDEKNRILFGDNVNGFRPERNSIVEIEYQTGIGTRGNVAAGTLTRLPGEVKGVTFVTNLFAGENGRDPETEEHGKRWGPKIIKIQERAVTFADYEREAMRVPGVSRAMARFVWTGSWVTVRVTIDPEGTEELSDELKAAVYRHLVSRKMAGYDIQIFPVRYVPLKIGMRFCLNERAFRDQVFRDLNSALGNTVGADGVKGLFHPDNWTFAQGVKLSSLYAAAARVQGIECAEVTVFKRLRKPKGDEMEKGEIPMQWDEIAQMDNDRDFPERGTLDLELAGGR